MSDIGPDSCWAAGKTDSLRKRQAARFDLRPPPKGAAKERLRLPIRHSKGVNAWALCFCAWYRCYHAVIGTICVAMQRLQNYQRQAQGYRSLTDQFIYSALSNMALAPDWEVQTARIQTSKGDPLAGLTETQRAQRNPSPRRRFLCAAIKRNTNRITPFA
jgi:hypothetical protein